MTDVVRCHRCGASHDASDLFCPQCAAACSAAPTAADGEQSAPASELTDVLLVELQESLAPVIQVIRELGAGGMGTVYLGRDAALRRPVAIKVLNPQLAEVESVRLRFEREAQAAAAVGHPNVVGIYQVGLLPRSGAPYFVMQFIDGQTLADAFPPGKRATGPQARRIIGETASALAAAHVRGLVHRDIKPANIIIERESGRTVVLDFGISAILRREQPSPEPRLTATGVSVGTPTYMSPEQAAAGEVSDRSDVYSLGVVAFQLLTGRPPFVETSPWALMAAHIKEAPPKVRALAPDTDPLLADLVDRTLSKEPHLRPAASDVGRALLPERQPLVEWPPPGLEAFRGLARRSVVLFLISALLILGYFADLLSRPASSLGTSPEQSVVALLFRTGPSVTLLMLAFMVVYPALYFAVRAADGLLQARKLGYPLWTAAECLLDAHADTQDAMNGYGRFALMSEAQRRRLLRGRWWRTAILVGASWTAVGGLLAATSRLRTWGLVAEGGRSSLDLLAIPSLLIVAVLWLKVRERRSLGLPVLPQWRRRTDAVAGGTEAWLKLRTTSGIGRAPFPAATALVLGLTLITLVGAPNLPVFAAAKAVQLRQMAANLQQLADVEELVHSLKGSYSPSVNVIAASSYSVSRGVTVTLMDADSSGWYATAKHYDGGTCEARAVRPEVTRTSAAGARNRGPIRVHVSCSYGGTAP